MKYYGKIGFARTVETAPGVWTENMTERDYMGDVVRATRRLQPGTGANDNVEVTNTFSVVADPFAMENFHAIRYVSWLGTIWKVTSVEVQYPRLILSVGGVYNA